MCSVCLSASVEQFYHMYHVGLIRMENESKSALMYVSGRHSLEPVPPSSASGSNSGMRQAGNTCVDGVSKPILYVK